MRNIVFLLGFLLIGPANAGVINDFKDGYAVTNWTQVLDGGSINTSGAPSTVALTSSNAGGGAANTDFTIAALGDGLVTFDWSFTTLDWNASYDPFGYLLNGTFAVLKNSGGNGSGSASFSVLSGDIFGFRANSADSGFGAATTTISNFSAPTIVAVPEPGTLVLFGLGLAGIGFMAKRKKS